MSFLRHGLRDCKQYQFPSVDVFLRIIPRIRLPWEAAILHYYETFMLAFIVSPIMWQKTSELYLSHFENVVVPAADMCVWVISGFPATNIFFILKERADQITIHKVMFWRSNKPFSRMVSLTALQAVSAISVDTSARGRQLRQRADNLV